MLKAVVIVVIIRPRDFLTALFLIFFTNFHVDTQIARKRHFYVCIRNIHVRLESADLIVSSVFADDQLVIAHVLVAAAAKGLSKGEDFFSVAVGNAHVVF